MFLMFFFFFKQKTAYEMRISDWSSDVCSSDLPLAKARAVPLEAMPRMAALARGHAVHHVVFLIGRGHQHHAGAHAAEHGGFHSSEQARLEVLNGFHQRRRVKAG